MLVPSLVLQLLPFAAAITTTITTTKSTECMKKWPFDSQQRDIHFAI